MTGQIPIHRAIRDGKPDATAAVHLDSTPGDCRGGIRRLLFG